jgi:hypothetical protein
MKTAAAQPELFSAKAKLAKIVKQRRARMPPTEAAAWIGMRLRRSRGGTHMPPETCCAVAQGITPSEPVAVFAIWRRRGQLWEYNAYTLAAVREMIALGFWRLTKT